VTFFTGPMVSHIPINAAPRDGTLIRLVDFVVRGRSCLPCLPPLEKWRVYRMSSASGSPFTSASHMFIRGMTAPQDLSNGRSGPSPPKYVPR
jgi:hypothetical protein